jgi:hypothetical protein
MRAYSRVVVVVQSVRSAVCVYSLGCCEIRVRVRNKVRAKIEEKSARGANREREREREKLKSKRKEPGEFYFVDS